MRLKKSAVLPVVFIIITGLSVMLICTKSSPFYPLNDWTDANCYMTVGRAMTEGKMPYRDLFEHKGPFIYIIHAAGAIISGDSFFGIFIFETIACIFFLWLSSGLFLKITNNRSLWAVPVIAMTVYSSYAFCHGDSAEEFCLPLILGTLILGLDAAEQEKTVSCVKSFFMGVLTGIILWTKFNLLGFFAGAFAVIAVLSHKNGIAQILRMTVFIVLGICAVSLPVILFFAAEKSFGSLIEVYFYDNIFVYGGEKTSPLRNLADGCSFTLKFMPIGSAVILSGISAAFFKGMTKYAVYGSASLFTAFLGTFAGHLSYRYYPLVLGAFVPFFAAAIIPVSSKIKARAIAPASLVLSLAAAFFLSPNTYLMRYKKNQMPQYRFAKLINETKSPTLLNYGFLDGGFYFASGIIPDQRYFCRNNTGLTDMTKSQLQCVENGIPDYIVTRSASGEHPKFPLYDCIAEDEFSYDDKIFHYFLFRRKNLYKSP